MCLNFSPQQCCPFSDWVTDIFRPTGDQPTASARAQGHCWRIVQPRCTIWNNKTIGCAYGHHTFLSAAQTSSTRFDSESHKTSEHKASPRSDCTVRWVHFASNISADRLRTTQNLICLQNKKLPQHVCSLQANIVATDHLFAAGLSTPMDTSGQQERPFRPIGVLATTNWDLRLCKDYSRENIENCGILSVDNHWGSQIVAEEPWHHRFQLAFSLVFVTTRPAMSAQK